MKPIQNISYKDAEEFKYENARVKVGSLPTEEYIIEFKILSNDPSKRTIHKVNKNIVITAIKISPEAAFSLMIGLNKRLREDGIL